MSSELSTGEKKPTDKQAASEADELKQQLQESFKRVHDRSDKFTHECDLKREAKKLGMEVEEYRRLYELSTKPPSWLSRFWRWTGFSEKKLWDILQLLVVPLVLAGGAFYLQDNAKQREQAQADDRNRQESLNKYFDAMQSLLLESKLRTSKKDDEVRTIARARTLTTLRGLDGDRKGQLLSFLREAELVTKDRVIVSLRDADLSNANLSGAFLLMADLSGANLSGANLSDAFLGLGDNGFLGALWNTAKTANTVNLLGANLKDTNLKDASLKGAWSFSKEQEKQAKFCRTTLPDGKVSNRDCRALK